MKPTNGKNIVTAAFLIAVLAVGTTAQEQDGLVESDGDAPASAEEPATLEAKWASALDRAAEAQQKLDEAVTAWRKARRELSDAKRESRSRRTSPERRVELAELMAELTKEVEARRTDGVALKVDFVTARASLNTAATLYTAELRRKCDVAKAELKRLNARGKALLRIAKNSRTSAEERGAAEAEIVEIDALMAEARLTIAALSSKVQAVRKNQPTEG